MSDDDRSYRIPNETIPALDIAHHRDDVRELAEFLEGRGIATQNTRVDRYRQYLEEVERVGPHAVDTARIFKSSVGPPLLTAEDWFLYVLREVHELMWILKGLKVHVPEGLDPKLRTIVGGRDFAALDVDSQSRNAQFELRIASYFCQNGCGVDMSTDTDIVAVSSDFAFFVECKRVGSVNQLGKRLSEARTQLARRMPRKDGARLVLGCVAADVTKLAFAHNGLTWGITPEHARDVIRDKLISIAEAATRYLTFDSCRKLLTYWMQIHIASLALQPGPTPMTRFSSYQIPRPMLGRKERRVLSAFYDMFESVSRHDERSSAPEKLTRRTGVNFPTGTAFTVDRDVILRLLEKDLKDIRAEDQFVQVVSLEMSGQLDSFTFFDVSMLGRELIDEWKRDSLNDLGRANVALVARLYMRRYPYEEAAGSGELNEDVPTADV